MTNIFSGPGCRQRRNLLKRSIVASLFSVLGAAPAVAYVGESFLQVPGVAGGWPGEQFNDWIKLEAQYWGAEEPADGGFGLVQQRRDAGRGLKAGGNAYYSVPTAPREGPAKLSLALDKDSAALKPLMDLCRNKDAIQEAAYAESAELARGAREWGDRPPEIPEFFEYKLKDVRLSCPEVPEAPEQAFVLSFESIEWTNYEDPDIVDLDRAPADLPPAQPTGETRTFVLTTFVNATDVHKDQCPAMSQAPTEADFYALMSKEVAEQERAKYASMGGVQNSRNRMMYRGPGKLSACHLPGTVRDPGHPSPQSDIARGFNLDGDDGSAAARPGLHKHKNYVSEDGRKGIDNQLFAIDGCIPAFQENGLLTAARVELMRNGTITMLVQISGVDDPRNDDSVDVAVLYATDPMVKNAAGNQILPYYTFRLSDDPELAPDFARVHGRIENGVVIVDSIEDITLHEGSSIRLTLHDARMRIELAPDGSMKGVIGGYYDWRILMNFRSVGAFEVGFPYQCPGIYNAFKRAADGLPHPVTGEFRGVSTAYDFEGVPAFITPESQDRIALNANLKD